MNTEPKFKVGDVVKLKSFGTVPFMTVYFYISNSKKQVSCHFFDTRNRLQSGVFSEDELQIVP